MAVVEIKEKFRGRKGTGKADETVYTRVFSALTDNGQDGPDVVYAAIALPPWNVVLGATFPTNGNAKLISANPSQGKAPTLWTVTVTYSTKQDIEPDPANDEVEITWDDEDIQRPVTEDRDGNAVCTSAGEPPVEPLMGEDAAQVCTIKANVASLPVWFPTTKKAINSDSITIDGVPAAPKFARIKSRSLTWWKYRGSYAYRELTLKIEIADAAGPDFELRWLDQGFIRKPTAAEITDGMSANDRVPITVNGSRPSTAQLLDGSGNLLSNPSLSTAVFNATPYHRLVAFGALPGVSV